ncbi:unnamed protein product [Merluccius merluccius]
MTTGPSVVIKSFERLVLAHLKDITGLLLDPLQECTSGDPSVKLLKFADTPVISPIRNGDENNPCAINS